MLRDSTASLLSFENRQGDLGKVVRSIFSFVYWNKLELRYVVQLTNC